MNNNIECQELKNIQYKSMLLTGIPLKETKSSDNIFSLEKYLENEKEKNINEPWCKLNKTIKTQKLLEYAETYKNEKNLDELESKQLMLFFKDCLDKKRLLRVKDVVYDNKNRIIKDIPALLHDKVNKHFTLRNIDKRVSTLKSLAPKKTQGTIKKIEKHDSDTDSNV
jgi:hypothetical protein